MYFTKAISLFAGITAATASYAQQTKAPAQAPKVNETAVYFEQNLNQWPAQVIYKANVSGGAVWLEQNRLTWTTHSLADLNRIHDEEFHSAEAGQAHKHEAANEKVKCHAWYVHFEGASPSPSVVPVGLRNEYSNYFIGNNPDKWAGNVARYNSVIYQQLYPGISFKAYSSGVNFKYDFQLNAGADASLIKLRYEGINIALNSNGNLELNAHSGAITEQAPVAWQVVNGKTIPVRCLYKLNGQVLSFEFPDGYDKTQPLIIDPVIV
ncbi:MAG: hypothetical protein ACRC3B_23245, partial [Bacteroidia bacterium]